MTTREEHWRQWAIDGMPADKIRLADATWDAAWQHQQQRIDALEAAIKDHDAQCIHTCNSRATNGTCAYRDKDGAYRYPNGMECHDCPKEYIIRILENTAPPAPLDTPGQATQAEAVELAKLFHETYENQAPIFSYETRPETREFDSKSPNGMLMISVCTVILAHLKDIGFNEGIEAYAAKLKRIGFVNVDDITMQLKKGA